MSAPSERAKQAATLELQADKSIPVGYYVQQAIDAALAELAKNYHVQHLNLEKAEAEIARLVKADVDELDGNPADYGDGSP